MLFEALHTGISSNHPLIENIQIRCSKAPSSYMNERAQIGWRHWNDIEYRPGGIYSRAAECLYHVKPFDHFFLLISRPFMEPLAQRYSQSIEIQGIEALAYSFPSCLGSETVTIQQRQFSIAILIKKGPWR